MKIKHLLILLSTLALFSCGGGQNNGGGTGNQASAIDTISAFELFKKYNPELAEQHKDADTSGKLYYSFYDPDNYNEFGGPFVNLYYLNLNSGGNLIVYQHAENDMMSDLFVSQFHLFRYVNGELTEDKDLLPAPTIDDFAEVDGLTFYNPTEVVKDFFAKKEFYYQYLPESGLLMVQVIMYNDPVNIYFKWDGSKFVLDSKHDPKSPQNIITAEGLGQIHLGDNPPENIVGYQKTTFGNVVYYNRDGQKEFKLSLNKEGKIDTITVLSPLITFRFDCDGPTNDHFGVGFKPVDFCGGENFEFRDGVWIRSLKNTCLYYCGFMRLSEDIVDSLGVIDFYTTKNAITNLYPEIGKVVTWKDNPKIDPNATVTQIKLYHRQPDTGREIFNLIIQEHEKMGENNNLLHYGDMADEYYDNNKTDDGINIYNNGSQQVYVHIYKCFPLNDGGFKIYEYVAWEHGYRYDGECDPFDETRNLYCFIYKDGKLTPAALEPEIDTDLYSSPFNETGLSGFVWNGERMVPQEPQE